MKKVNIEIKDEKIVEMERALSLLQRVLHIAALNTPPEKHLWWITHSSWERYHDGCIAGYLTLKVRYHEGLGGTPIIKEFSVPNVTKAEFEDFKKVLELYQNW